MSNRKQRRAKRKHSPKELPEPVKAALERRRPEQFGGERRPGGDGRSGAGSADFRRVGQHRHQDK